MDVLGKMMGKMLAVEEDMASVKEVMLMMSKRLICFLMFYSSYKVLMYVVVLLQPPSFERTELSISIVA